MIKERLINLAVEEAKKSTYKHRIGSIIFHKKNIISSDHNYELGVRKKLHPRFQRFPTSIHAETSTIIKAKTDLKNCSILIVRINRQNQLRLAKPCLWCFEYIQFVGIKEIFYSISAYPYIERIKL